MVYGCKGTKVNLLHSSYNVACLISLEGEDSNPMLWRKGHILLMQCDIPEISIRTLLKIYLHDV